jgi:hypothetical protein
MLIKYDEKNQNNPDTAFQLAQKRENFFSYKLQYIIINKNNKINMLLKIFFFSKIPFFWYFLTIVSHEKDVSS